jgi:hypothetical protein
MSEYQERLEQCMYQELKHVYPFLAPPDERTAEERKRDAELAIVELFGPEDNEEAKPCPSKD